MAQVLERRPDLCLTRAMQLAARLDLLTAHTGGEALSAPSFGWAIFSTPHAQPQILDDNFNENRATKEVWLYQESGIA
eukprot:1141960-Pelagomonas_calceolata.AAC.7